MTRKNSNTKKKKTKTGTKTKSITYSRSTTKTKSIKRKGTECRIKYMYIIGIGASKKDKKPLYLGSNDDAPIMVDTPQIWMICRPLVKKEDPQYYYIFDELGRVLTHRICGDSGNVILENVVDLKFAHARWLIDNVKHKIQPYDNHLLALDYDPTRKYGVIVRRANFHMNFNQTWDFKEKLEHTKSVSKSRSKVLEFNKEDIGDLFVSHQNSKLLKFAKRLPAHGYVKAEISPNRTFCYIDVSHWDKHAEKFREKIIQYYDFMDSSSLYYFINKYYPFIVKHHKLTPKSKLYLATKIYKKGYHISLYQNSKDLAGKKMKFNCVSLNHLVNRSYDKIISEQETQYVFAPNKYYGIAWFFIETEFKSPMTCFNSQMPIPHVSVGLILYEPPSGHTINKSDNVSYNSINSIGNNSEISELTKSNDYNTLKYSRTKKSLNNQNNNANNKDYENNLHVQNNDLDSIID